jgi:hypothetical protein
MDTIRYTGKVARMPGYTGVGLSLDCEVRCPVCKQTTHLETYGAELSVAAVKDPQGHVKWLADLACEQHSCSNCGVVSQASQAGKQALVDSLLGRYTPKLLRALIAESGAKPATGTGRYPAPDDSTYEYGTWEGGAAVADQPVDIQPAPLSGLLVPGDPAAAAKSGRQLC